MSEYPLLEGHPKTGGLLPALVCSLFLLVPLRVEATQIAAWGFDDGTAQDTSGTPPAYDLAAVGGGPDLSLGYARFDGLEASPSYLEVAGPGGMFQYTVSLWVRSQGAINQGTFQGIMSNNVSSSALYSWQVESHNGAYQWRNSAGTFGIGAPSGLGVWDHIVVRKLGFNDGDIWLNGVQVLANVGGNPGGLQYFRLGTNRETSRFWQGDIDGVGVYDTLEDPTLLYASPPASVPEPAVAFLAGTALMAVAARRDRRQASSLWSLPNG